MNSAINEICCTYKRWHDPIHCRLELGKNHCGSPGAQRSVSWLGWLNACDCGAGGRAGIVGTVLGPPNWTGNEPRFGGALTWGPGTGGVFGPIKTGIRWHFTTETNNMKNAKYFFEHIFRIKSWNLLRCLTESLFQRSKCSIEFSFNELLIHRVMWTVVSTGLFIWP